MNLYIRARDGQANWGMQNGELLRLMGIKRIPEGGLIARQIQGIWVWAVPLEPKSLGQRKRNGHRLMGRCPVCAKVMSVGRMQQHARVHIREAEMLHDIATA